MAALAIHPGALGDVLLAVPALRALRGEHAPLTLAAQPRISALLEALGVVDRAVAFDTLGLDALFSDAPLRADALLARYLTESSRVACWFGARDDAFVRRLHALAPAAVIARPHTTAEPVWQHLLHTVGGRADCAPIAVPPALVDAGRAALRAIGWDGVTRVLVVHPGAGSPAKCWPAACFAGAIDGVDATIVVSQGPADADAAAVEALVARSRQRPLCLIDPPLPTLAGVLATAGFYVGNDSGVSHLAAAVGARSLVLFARTALPWISWSPTARRLTVTPTEAVPDERRAVCMALRELL